VGKGLLGGGGGVVVGTKAWIWRKARAEADTSGRHALCIQNQPSDSQDEKASASFLPKKKKASTSLLPQIRKASVSFFPQKRKAAACFLPNPKKEGFRSLPSFPDTKGALPAGGYVLGP